MTNKHTETIHIVKKTLCRKNVKRNDFSNKTTTTTTNKYFSESTCPKAEKLIFSQESYVDLTVKTGWNC